MGGGALIRRPQNPTAGRVDVAARHVFNSLLHRHGNPVLRGVCRAFDGEITECLAENFGPETRAGRVGERIARALGVFK